MLMIQVWLQKIRRASNTTSKHSRSNKDAQVSHQLGKTHTMVTSRKPTECNIEIEEHSLKNVNETVLLGVKISADGRMERELDRRFGRVMSIFGSLKKDVFGSRELSWKAKVYNAVVVPMMPILTVFWLDLANAFGSIHHQLICFSLKHYHAPASMIATVSNLYQ